MPSETYTVPYRGEEVFFHWANKDQHYVKTAETFRDYAFTVETLSGPARIRFALTEANVPPGNLKGDTRYFFPVPEDATWSDDSRTFQLPFHYWLPSEKEVDRYGKNSKLQESLLQEALPKILKRLPDANVHAVLSDPIDQKEDQQISLLLKRLRHFCRRNTTDYFIHKDLQGFLARELEFYIKDQVLHLGDLDGDLDAKRRVIRVFRQLAEEVITFLAQIENVQKRLFEKRKFVLRTDYLVPIKEVPHELWKEVLANKDQIKSWKDLFAIEPKKDLFNKTGKLNDHFLKEHPTLVVNTFYFKLELKDKLLASFSDLDDATDGLLIHGENYQALRLLERKYAGKIKCIYVDAPYNTGKDEFIYKDRYRHSSWLAMMEERLKLAKNYLSIDGVLYNSIDGNELSHLTKLLEHSFGYENHLGTLVWKNATDNNPTRIATEHEYVLGFAKNIAGLKSEWKSSYSYAKELLLDYYQGLKARGLPLNVIQAQFQEFIKDNSEIVGELERYKFVDNDGPYTGSESVHNPHPNGYYYDIFHPVSGKPMRKPANGYRFPQDTMKREFIEKERLIYGPDENRIVKIKLYLRDYVDSLRSVIMLDGRLGAYGLSALFGKGKSTFDNPKPVQLLERLLSFASETEETILDFVAGSATTAHAVLNLNSRDGGRRKFILVEMADYFDTVLLPRIQKVMYTRDWKDGKPVRAATKDEASRIPRLVKMLHVEGYDDALHNLATEKTLKREPPRANAHKKLLGEDAYRLHYLVRLPLESNAAMLSVEALEHPFEYTIEVLTENGPQTQAVDLIETFNLLYGLHVSRLETWLNAKDNRTYKAVKGKKNNGESVLILWRDMIDLDPVIEREFLQAKLKTEGPFDEVLVNGDSATPGVKSLDGIFKRLLEEEER